MTVKTAPAHRPVQSPLVMALPLTGALIGEAGSETEHAPLSARAGQLADVQGGDRGFPVDAGRSVPGSLMLFPAWMKQAKSSRASHDSRAMISPVAASIA